MDVLEIAPGLWRWTGYHEEAKEDVGSLYCETEDGVVLVDPLVPPEDAERFFGALDREVSGQQAHLLVTIFWHTRSAATNNTRAMPSNSLSKESPPAPGP